MKKIKVKYFNDEQSLSVFIDKAIAKRKSIGIQPTTDGRFTVCY